MQVDRTEPRAESAGQLAADVRPQVVYAGVVGERDLNQTNLHNLPQPDPNTVQCAWGLASCARRVCVTGRALPQRGPCAVTRTPHVQV